MGVHPEATIERISAALKSCNDPQGIKLFFGFVLFHSLNIDMKIAVKHLHSKGISDLLFRKLAIF